MGGCMSSSADASGGGAAYGSSPSESSWRATPHEVRGGGGSLGGPAAKNPSIPAAEAARNAALARFEARPADIKAADERAAKDSLVVRIGERYRRAGQDPPIGLGSLPLAKLRVIADSGTLPGGGLTPTVDPAISLLARG